MSGARTLVVVRHAKAEVGAGTDLDRALTDEGRAAAFETGRWLAAQGVAPERALVSPALRTEQTWRALAEGAGWDLAPVVDEALYETVMFTVLDLVHEIPVDVRTLVIVGHNPTMASLALLLDDGEGDRAALTEMAVGFPTGAAAVYGYRGEWADLEPATASVSMFHVGRA